MKTFNKTLAIGAAVTAAAILAPAAFAQGPHGGPPPRPSNGIQLAADIVNLVLAVIEPRPAPVIVAPRERVVTTQVVTTTPTVVTTTPATTVVTEAVTIPEYSYSFFYGEYVPYFEGWFYYSDAWIWGGIGPRPPAPPRWAPPPRRRDLPPPRTGTVVVRPEPRGGGHSVTSAPAPRREAPRTVTVRPETRNNSNPVVPSQHRVPRKNGR